MPSKHLLDWANQKEGKMPSKTQKQARTMAAAAHDPKFAKKVGIPTKVAKDFNASDTGTKRLAKSATKASKKRGAKSRKR
jgi:hypothetical protein